jgi:hypothetical protein
MVSSFLTTDQPFLTYLNGVTVDAVDAVGDSSIWFNAVDEVLDSRAGVQG